MEEVLGGEEEEIELSLGLSIGGGKRNFKNNNQILEEVHQKSISTFDFQICDQNDITDESSSRIQYEYSYSYSPSCVCSSSSSLSVDDGDGDHGEGVLDPERMMRREMRRQEEEDERKKQQLQKKKNVIRKYFDLEEEEEDGSDEQQICKKLRSEEEEEENESSLNQISFPTTTKMQQQYVVPFAFPYYYYYHHIIIMPSSSSSSGNGDGNIAHPIAARCIPFETSLPPMMKSFDFEQNYVSSSRCGGGGDKASSGSAGSSSSSSSAVSDYGRNVSHHGGSSCETRSHSCQSPLPEQHQLNVPVMSNVQVQSELNTSFNPTESCSLVFEKTNTNIVCSNDVQSNPAKTEENQVPAIDPHPIDKPNSVTDYPLPAFLLPDQHSKGANMENFKSSKPQPPRQLQRTNEEASKPLISEPPHQLTGTNGESNLITSKLTQPCQLLKRTNEEARKPFIPEPSHRLTETKGESNLITPKQTQTQTKSLPRMPCVSTVGNGPNGKTVTGFLYRYTKTEVSIICVCHGSSFSPAEFVKHAGGTDVSHPLKDIVVVPSAIA